MHRFRALAEVIAYEARPDVMVDRSRQRARRLLLLLGAVSAIGYGR